MSEIKILSDRIIIDGHADTREQCEVTTMLANLLATMGSGFSTIEYRSGYAEFKKSDVVKLRDNELMFEGVPGAEATINFDSHITKVEVTDNSSTIEYTTTSQTHSVSVTDGNSYVFNVTLADGYVLDTVTLSNSTNSSDGELISQTDTTFTIAAGGNGIVQTITLTSKQTVSTPTFKHYYDAGTQGAGTYKFRHYSASGPIDIPGRH